MKDTPLDSLRESIRKLTRIPAFLIVEDDAADAEFLEKRLKDYFKKCFTVILKSGEEALTAIASVQFDVIFLDLRLSGMGGIEFMRAIIGKGGRRPALVIVTGLNGESDLALEAIRMGAVRVIAKPVTPEDLSDTFGTL